MEDSRALLLEGHDAIVLTGPCTGLETIGFLFALLRKTGLMPKGRRSSANSVQH